MQMIHIILIYLLVKILTKKDCMRLIICLIKFQNSEILLDLVNIIYTIY